MSLGEALNPSLSLSLSLSFSLSLPSFSLSKYLFPSFCESIFLSFYFLSFSLTFPPLSLFLSLIPPLSLPVSHFPSSFSYPTLYLGFCESKHYINTIYIISIIILHLCYVCYVRLFIKVRLSIWWKQFISVIFWPKKVW